MLQTTASFRTRDNTGSEWAIALFRQKESNVLKKMCAIGGLVITAASGAVLTSPPASAAIPVWGGCCGGDRTRDFNRHWDSARNFNVHQNDVFNRIRFRINNRNNNAAIARENQAERQWGRADQRQRQNDRWRNRENRNENRNEDRRENRRENR